MCCTPARWKYRTQKLRKIVAICAPLHNFVGSYFRNHNIYRQSEKKLVKYQYLFHISSQYAWWTLGHKRLRSVGEFGVPQQISAGFVSWLCYCTDVAQWRSTKLCTMFGRLLGWYTIYIFGLLPPNGILPGAKFTLRPTLVFSYFRGVTARHSSSGREPNFAAFSGARHLYWAGRPSSMASAHILVYTIIRAELAMADLDFQTDRGAV